MKKEQLTIAKIADKINKYKKTGNICSTNFLDPTEILESENIVRDFPYCFFGGFEDAERKILVVGADEEEKAKEFIEILTIELLDTKSDKTLSHRSVLGSLLGLGINRDVLGDIIIKKGRADFFVTTEIARYILQNLDFIGREKVKVYKNSYDQLLRVESLAQELKTTVASLRIDAIISSALGISREVSSKLIQNQKVKLNYKLIENTSKQIKEGDKISVRGYGRIELTEIVGETRKDRIRILLKKS